MYKGIGTRDVSPNVAERCELASGNQRRYVRAELAGQGSYMIPLGHLVEGPFDEAAFRQAAHALVRRHEALRTRFEISGQEVLALVYPEPEAICATCALSDASLSAFRAWALPKIFKDVNPRERGSLIRFLAADLGDSWRFTIAAHHAITDGFSRGVMARELLKLYAGEALEPPGSYYAFKAGDQAEADDRDIKERVEALPEPIRLIGDGSAEDKETGTGQFVQRDFVDVSKHLRARAKSMGATRFSVLSGIYALGLAGFAGSRDLSTFFQSEGRKCLGAPNSVVGPFSNTLPLNLAIDLDEDFGAFVRGLSRQVHDMVALESAPILDATLDAQRAPSVSINMFPPAPRIAAGDLAVGPREFLDRRTEFDLNLVWAEDRRVLSARAYYDGALLSEERVGLFLEMQERLLAAVLVNSERSCRELLADARAGHEVISPPVTTEPEPEQRLHERFFDWAERTPDATAIVTTGGEMTYEALRDDAYAVMDALQSVGVTSSDRVAVFAERSPRLVAAMLGVSATGASFTVIDASYPVQRVAHMLRSLDTQFVLLAGAEAPDGLGDLTVIRPSGGPVVNRPFVTQGAPRSVAYHLFTSGTTGTPRLVSHADQSVQRFIDWQFSSLELDRPVATMMLAGLSHDPTLRDVFLPLSYGGRIAIPAPCEMADPVALRSLFREARCNVVRFSAATSRLLTAGKALDAPFPDLRAIFWGGERLPRASVRQWRDMAPAARQFNVFGTTETPQAFLIHEIGSEDTLRREIPLGRVLPWTGVRLIDGDGATVSTGEVGEMVADLADPAIGAHDPTGPEIDGEARRHFTGDLAYQLSDGLIYFAGRRDSQVKINGYRVELGELEATAEGVDGVEHARAIFENGNLRLFVLADPRAVTAKDIKFALHRSLPSYMWPVQVMILSEFPTTPNGKVDEAALSEIAAEARIAHIDRPVDAPVGAAEAAIASVLSRNTGGAQVGRTQSLDDLGADSLSTVETRIDLEALGLSLPDDWPWLSVADLARIQPNAVIGEDASKGLLQNVPTEAFLVMRAIAIVSVVTFHSGVPLVPGASLILFVMAGYAFARLQLPGILREESARRVWALMARLLVVLVPVSLVYYAKHAIFDGDAHLSTILPYRNFAELVDILLLGRDGLGIQLPWLWFLHVYLQIFAIFGVVLSSARIRALLAADAWTCLLIFFAMSEVLGVSTMVLLGYWTDDFRTSSDLLMGSPTTIMPLLVLGALCALADSRQRIMVSLALSLAHWGVSQFAYITHDEIWWALALAICVSLPTITMPRLLSTVVVILSVHSLMIYLTHHAATFLFVEFTGGTSPLPASIAFQLAVGLLVGVAVRRAIQGRVGTQ